MGDSAIESLERKIQELKELSRRDGIDLSTEIAHLEEKLAALKVERIKEPDDWQKVKLARHPKRPYTLDYIQRMMKDFYELRGDRLYGDDQAIVGGLASFEGQTVAVIGTQRGRDAEENRMRNFGMPNPEGYRKALRIMRLAERFSFPVLSFIDTAGAYPGKGAEERNIAGAIAQNIYEMSRLRVPIVVNIIGEGGSGGALGLGVGDRILMLENATYSVITPEGCAAILFRDSAKAPEAAKALKLTAPHLFELGVIDEIVPEPAGGAQNDYDAAARSLKEALQRHFNELCCVDIEELLLRRQRRFQKMGVYEELAEAVEESKGQWG